MRLWIFQIPKRYICKNLPTSSLFGIFSKKSITSWLELDSYDCTNHEIEKNQKIYKYVTHCTTNSQNKVLHNLTENSSRAQRFGILKRNKNTGKSLSNCSKIKKKSAPYLRNQLLLNCCCCCIKKLSVW